MYEWINEWELNLWRMNKSMIELIDEFTNEDMKKKNYSRKNKNE